MESTGYIFVNENQGETLRCSIQYNLFPEYLRLQLDMLVITHLYSSSVCLSGNKPW